MRRHHRPPYWLGYADLRAELDAERAKVARLKAEFDTALTEWIAAGAPAPQGAACHHCGSSPDEDGDHSCPCPHTDADCPDHPEASR